MCNIHQLNYKAFFMTDLSSWLTHCRNMVNDALQKKLPNENAIPQNLHKAMHYAVLNGGKRLRAAFVLATGELFHAETESLIDIAVALELIHAFSLIHDDLPALDNDDLRRGKPTCHLVFGEATAILAGDALQSLAFEILASLNPAQVSSDKILAMIRILSRATGSLGMTGGETLDIEMVNKKVSVDAIEAMYTLKTGCLLRASMQLALLASRDYDETNLYHLAQFGENLGVAFQIHDDIIGITSDTETLGKKQQADIALNKPVYPVITSLEAASQRRDFLLKTAREHLQALNRPCDRLYALSEYVITRNH